MTDSETQEQSLAQQARQYLRRRQDLLINALIEAGADGVTLHDFAAIKDADDKLFGYAAAKEALASLPPGLYYTRERLGEFTRYIGSPDLVEPDVQTHWPGLQEE